MAQRYQKVVQEDLNVGTSATWVAAPGGGELRSIQVGLHSVARGQREYTATWAPGSIATTSKASTTVTVPDAAVGDFVLASHDKMLTSDLRISGHVSAANTAKVVIHNPTSAAVTVASGTVSVLVFPSITSSTDPVYDEQPFTWSQEVESWIVSFGTTITEDYPGQWDEGGVITWTWDDGGGDTVIYTVNVGANATTHNYSSAGDGTYTVTLTVVGNTNGFSSYAEAEVTVDYWNGSSGSSGD